jgi:hypothetical protein
MANNIIEEEEATLRTTIPTLEDEIKATGMMTEEIQTWNNWEQYATTTKLVSRTQLDALAQQYKNGQKNWQNVFYFASSILYSGYVVYRAYQARSRAYAARTNYYSSGASGTKGDAFRHIYASMHLRRYVGSWVVQLVGWANEVRNPNQCHDREMDFHNNRVGYSTKYSTFRNGTSRHDYGRWGRRVRDFVNNSGANGTLQSGWNWSATNPLNCTIVDNDVANTSNNRYIYYIQ